MLIKRATLEKIVAGEISVVFRRWKHPSVKAGGTQMTQVGILGIDEIEILDPASISEFDLAGSEFSSIAELNAALSGKPGELYRIKLNYVGKDPRVFLRENADLSPIELKEIIGSLAKIDRASRSGAWTQRFLDLIDKNPAVYSGGLAEKVGIEKAKFKPMVRRLKALGLTESLEVGYRLSPRGKAVLNHLIKTK